MGLPSNAVVTLRGCIVMVGFSREKERIGNGLESWYSLHHLYVTAHGSEDKTGNDNKDGSDDDINIMSGGGGGGNG